MCMKYRHHLDTQLMKEKKLKLTLEQLTLATSWEEGQKLSTLFDTGCSRDLLKFAGAIS